MFASRWGRAKPTKDTLVVAVFVRVVFFAVETSYVNFYAVLVYLCSWFWHILYFVLIDAETRVYLRNLRYAVQKLSAMQTHDHYQGGGAGFVIIHYAGKVCRQRLVIYVCFVNKLWLIMKPNVSYLLPTTLVVHVEQSVRRVHLCVLDNNF